MGALDGRVAIITGAGRGIGREHALLFAAEGAKVVVNDLGGDPRRRRAPTPAPADEVVEEIRAARGRGGRQRRRRRRLGRRPAHGADQAIETFGDLHVLVNNAGILRDRMLVNMTEDGVGRRDAGAPEGPRSAHPPRGRVLARAVKAGKP